MPWETEAHWVPGRAQSKQRLLSGSFSSCLNSSAAWEDIVAEKMKERESEIRELSLKAIDSSTWRLTVVSTGHRLSAWRISIRDIQNSSEIRV